MRQFEYTRADSIDAACASLKSYGTDAALLAGGTDLLIEWRRANTKSPRLVIDISGIGALAGIKNESDEIEINPLTTHTAIMKSQAVRSAAPLLAIAAANIGSPQIRNRGTIGGNVMNAATCADTVPPLVALGATATLQSGEGKRTIGLHELFIKPYQTVAKPDELLTSISFKKLQPGMTSAFIKLGRRNALSISRLSVAAIIKRDADGRITEARIVPGAALPVWKRIAESENMVIGEMPSMKLFAAAGLKASEVMIGHTGRRWSTEYKEPVLAVLVKRALAVCAGIDPLAGGKVS
jgi:CO/xanthine dehydrogenase FAD-binding subunit